MTIKECIDIVDNLKPNQYSIENKVDWLSYIDHSIINEVLLTHEGYDGRYDDFTGYSADKLNMGLIVPSPYDRLYPAYIKMKIDEENGETARYNNSVTMFNAYLMEYKKWYNSKHMPLSPSDRRTLPPRKPSSLDVSEAQLEQLRKLLYAEFHDDMLKELSNDKLYAIVKAFMDTNAQMLKGKDGRDGVDGKNGSNGKDGLNGANGVGIQKAWVSDEGELKITLTSGVTSNLGVVKGEKGDRGERGMEGAKGDKGDRGEKGEKGNQGERGLTGPQGIQGDKGANGKSAYEYALNGGFEGTEEEFAILMAEAGKTEVDDALSEESKNPVQNKVLTKEVDTLKEHNTQLKETIEKLQIKVTTEKASFHNIKDSANMKVVDFGMEGKTTQDGTPTPENQVEIVNAGKYNEATGRYEHKFGFVNKNHWDAEYARDASNWINLGGYDCIPIYVGKGSIVTLSYIQTLSLGLDFYVSLSKNGLNSSLYGWLYHSASNVAKNPFTIKAENDYIYVCCYENNATDKSIFMQYIGNDLQIEIADEPTDLVSHASQHITLTSPEPLTKWDKLVKRDGVYGWSTNHIHNPEVSYNDTLYGVSEYGNKDGVYVYVISLPNKAIGLQTSFCTTFKNVNNAYNLYQLWTYSDQPSLINMYFCTDIPTKEEFKAYLDKNPLDMWYKTAEEQAFHPLLEEEQELLRNIEMYYGVTNLYNDQGCQMWLEYVADTKMYIDNKFKQLEMALANTNSNLL